MHWNVTRKKNHWVEFEKFKLLCPFRTEQTKRVDWSVTLSQKGFHLVFERLQIILIWHLANLFNFCRTCCLYRCRQRWGKKQEAVSTLYNYDYSVLNISDFDARAAAMPGLIVIVKQTVSSVVRLLPRRSFRSRARSFWKSSNFICEAWNKSCGSGSGYVHVSRPASLEVNWLEC